MAPASIYVTQPFLPPLEDFLPHLEKIWASRILTNGGPFHEQLEAELAKFLGVPHVSLFANGTLALMTALQAFGITGEVITTPFTFSATAHAMLWNGIVPVFVDIEPDTCNLDSSRIEAAITPSTQAIMPVHCYGNPCDIHGIEAVARRHNLHVIYDAAHAFGVTHEGVSLTRAGDAAVLSFHATKIFNTFEGGAIVSHDPEIKRRIDSLKNFGFSDEVTVVEAGINGKMNEFQAALGLVQLPHVGPIIRRRGAIAARYRAALANVEGIRPIETPVGTSGNFTYFPVLVEPGYPLDRSGLYERLRDGQIYSRRYFYPLVSNMPMYKHLVSAAPERLPVATRIAERILCLPIYPALADADVDRICSIISSPSSRNTP